MFFPCGIMAKKIENIELKIRRTAGRFLELHEAEVHYRFADGTTIPAGKIEFVERRGVDSIVVAVYCEENGQVLMALTGQVRVPVLSRGRRESGGRLFLLESVAGSLEPGDSGRRGMPGRAAAEVFEEAGFDVVPGKIFSLGAPFFTSPGQSSEKIYPFAVKVKKKDAVKPRGDGSLLEKFLPPIKFHPLKKILRMAREGRIRDAKTEIAAMRLAFLLGVPVAERKSRTLLKKRTGTSRD